MHKIFFLILTLPFYGIAQTQSALCEDLASYACSPGVHEDGTGSSSQLSDPVYLAKKIFDANSLSVDTQIKSVVTDPENTEFRKKCISIFGLNSDPDCTSEEASDLNKCNNSITAGLHEFIAQKVFNKKYKQNSLIALRARDNLELVNDVYNSSQLKKVSVDLQKNLGLNLDQDNTQKNETIKNTIFPNIKKSISQRINQLPISESDKNKLLDHLKKVEYDGTDCSDSAAGLDEYFEVNAYYQNNKVHVCKGIVNNISSFFTLAFIIGHELSHSIDPCSLNLEGDKASSMSLSSLDNNYPVKGLLGCLRSSKSIQAESPAQGFIFQKHYSCRQLDQITESFADWMAVEALTDYMQNHFPDLKQKQWQAGFANVERIFCIRSNTGDDSDYDVHPLTQDRINKILLTNPDVRKKMGCTQPHSKYVYCDAQNPAALKKIIEETDPYQTGRRKKTLLNDDENAEDESSLNRRDGGTK